jgi:cbb3-type cytochrome oxidase subunit 3
MKRTLILILILIIGLTTLVSVALAAVDDDPIGPVEVPGHIPGSGVINAPQAQEKLIEFVRGLIRIAFLIGGVGVLFFFAIGGIRWIFSGGDKQQIDQAKSMITAALVGFVILALSYLALLIIGTFFKVPIVQNPPSAETQPCTNTCPSNPAGYGYSPGVDFQACMDDGGEYCQTSDCTGWCRL